MIAHSAPVSLPPNPIDATPTSETAKKRRRRAPATGAAEDCFSCRANGTKCDRKRPYCGPCLDLNVVCKGYRTQLTWGVGVASRGKLRGMSLPVTNAQLEERRARDKAGKKKGEDGNGASKADDKAPKRLRAPAPGTPGYGGIQRTSPPSNVKKLSIVTNYDFVNMEPPSSASAAPRSASISSQSSTQPAVSAGSPALVCPPPLPSSRIAPEQHSPQSALPSPYSTSQPRYHSPIMPPTASPAHHYPPSPAPTAQFKPPFGHVSMPPQQPHASPSMILSPMSEYEPSYPSPQQHQHYPMSSAPSNAPVYDLVSGVSSASYHPSSSMTVTTTGMSYSSMPAMHGLPRMMSSEHINHHSSGPHWTPANHGVSNLQHHHHHHHQQMTNGQGGISDLLYDEDVLAASSNSELSSSHSPSASVMRYPNSSTRHEQFRRFSHPPPPPPARSHSYPPQHSHPRSVSIDAGLTAPHLVNISGSQRYLIQYYDRTVCRALVAFDSPSNPYRTQILPMAFSNQSLLEAVYALSQSHLNSGKRLNQLPADYFTSQDQQSTPPLSPGSRALRFKSNATQLLQSQLSDPALAKQDAVSATLLMLLWHHICETGVAQFQVHLAGIKHLMMLREVGKETGRWGWMETVFTWMDNMAATINNREAQLRGGYLDMIYESTDEWGLENLVGCDRGLFMRLAGLGRMNTLSQMPTTSSSDSTASHSVHDNNNDPINPPRNENDGRSEFWMAWNAMKHDLSTYTAAPLPSSLSSSTAKSPAQQAADENNWTHSTHIYRYSALLYLDRLAYPHLPSSHFMFRSTLQQLFEHVGGVSAHSELAQKLLWPIFIAGAECVTDEHRDVVRARIAGMMSVGLGNRGSALDVLERVWMDSEIGESGAEYAHGDGGRGLRWRRCLEGEQAEYLLI